MIFWNVLIYYYRYLFVKMKEFNYSELHFAKVTFYKIHTLTLSRPRKADYDCPPNNTGTPGFSDLPTALLNTYIWCPSQGRRVSIFGEISTMTLEPPSKLESFLSTHAVTFPHRCTHLFCRLLILGMRVRLTCLTQASARALEQLSLGQCYQIWSFLTIRTKL